MKIRLILMGCILIVIGLILLVSKGFAAPLFGLPVVGIVLAALESFGSREKGQTTSAATPTINQGVGTD